MVCLARALAQLLVDLVLGQGQRPGPDDPLGQVAAQGGPPLLHVLDLVGLLAGVVVRRQLGLQGRVRDLQVEPVAELLELGHRELLHLVGGVAGLEVRAQGPALDGVGQDHGRLADVLGGRLERRVDLAVVVAAPGQVADLVVGQVLDHGPQPRVAAEEVLPDVGAGLDRVGLELPVRGGVHLVDQDAVGVLGQQRVPVPAPDDLDHVPAGAAERGLQLLDDLAVAAHRAVQPLQVGVDDEGEVVQLLAGRDADRAAGLGLVHLAVAQERPYVRAAGVLQLPGQQVPVEPGLVHRVDRAQAHGYRRELPEVGHEPRVRVGRQPAARVRELLAEPVELVLGQPSLQERPGVDARRGVALDEHLVARLAVVLAAEEVVEADFVEAGRGCVSRDVPAHPEARPVGPRDHDGRVPPDIGPDPALHVLVAGEPRLALGRDGVDEVGAAQARHADLLGAGLLQEPQHEVARPPAPAGPHDVIEGLDPLSGLVRVDVGQLAGQAVADDGEALASGGHGVFLAFRAGRASRPACVLVICAPGTRPGRRRSAPNPGPCRPATHLYQPVKDDRRAAGGWKPAA